MKIAVIGYGLEGISAANYFKDLGYQITICDQDESLDIPHSFEARLGNNYLDNIGGFDLIFRSAGINSDMIMAQNPDLNITKITTSTNEFFNRSKTQII